MGQPQPVRSIICWPCTSRYDLLLSRPEPGRGQSTPPLNTVYLSACLRLRRVDSSSPLWACDILPAEAPTLIQPPSPGPEASAAAAAAASATPPLFACAGDGGEVRM